LYAEIVADVITRNSERKDTYMIGQHKKKQKNRGLTPVLAGKQFMLLIIRPSCNSYIYSQVQ